VLVIIPTYKRLDQLKWTLTSLIKNKTEKIDNNLRVLILNNSIKHRKNVENIINLVKLKNKSDCLKWEWINVHRPITLDPVDNWYDGLLDYALDNEIVFFLGDDDLLTSDSLELRFNLIIKNNGDFLFSKFKAGVFYIDFDNAIYFKNKAPSTKTLSIINYNNLLNYQPIFLTNHCFKFTQELKDCICKVRKWKNKYPEYLSRDIDLFVPLFLPLFLISENFKLLGLDHFTSYRGVDLKEIRQSKYGVRSWNPGYISFLAYNVIKDNLLIENENYRDISKSLLDCYSDYYFTYLFDNRIPKQYRKTLLVSMKLGNYLRMLRSFRILMTDFLKLNGFKLSLHLKLKLNRIKISKLITIISTHH
jgi:hypothetical protein